MAGFKCPFCGQVMPDILNTHQETLIRFDTKEKRPGGYPVYATEYAWNIEQWRCPACHGVCTIATGDGEKTAGCVVHIYPSSTARQFPDYVPQAVRADYEEACAIQGDSPKAAATLARRCLQGMIRDFWKVEGKKNLYAEIDAIKDAVPAAQWMAIDAVRKIGNIGAHMEKDVDLIVDVEPEEAEKLLKLIELLIEKWYIGRNDEQELYRAITETGAAKTEAKKG